MWMTLGITDGDPTVLSAPFDWDLAKPSMSRLKEVLEFLSKPNNVATPAVYARLLVICGSENALREGRKIHEHISTSGSLQHDQFVLSHLVQMYLKCRSLVDAREVFREFPDQDVFSWTRLVGAYAQRGLCNEALELFQQVQLLGVKPDRVTFLSLLGACANASALEHGKLIHARVVESGLESDVILGNAVINMYSKCRSLVDACGAFCAMPHRDAVSWTALVSAYAQHGSAEEALEVFKEMQLAGIVPDEVAFVTAMNACASLQAPAEGELIHARIVESGLEMHGMVANAIVDMYGKCGKLENARRLFEKLHKQDVVLWNSMIAAYAQEGHRRDALQLFRQMQLEGVTPSRITVVHILNVFASPATLADGRMIHAAIAGSEFESDFLLETALVNMYFECGSLEDAEGVFLKMPSRRDLVLWNTMITGYALNGHWEQARGCYQKLQLDGFKPNRITFLMLLDACSSQEEAKAIDARIAESGFDLDVVFGASLIKMYGKSGSTENAWRVFKRVSQPNVVLWNAMVSALGQNGYPREALQFFQRMQQQGVVPDKITLLAVVNACANLAALAESKAIHACLAKAGWESDVVIGNAVIDMYSKCSSVLEARRMFDRMRCRDIISWNVMIGAYAHHGHVEQALLLFHEMQREGMKPNDVTFVGVLSACAHAGLVEEGTKWFVSMRTEHGLVAAMGHFGCMIDLLGRAGQLQDAEDFIKRMPVKGNAVVWMSMLGACKVHGATDRAIRIAEHVMNLDPDNTAPYVVLSNLYCAASRWQDAANLKKAMVDRGLKGKP